MTEARLPILKIDKCVNDSPHVVILGAGATRACIVNGDANGLTAPLMADLVETLDLAPTLDRSGISWQGKDFEQLYSELTADTSSSAIRLEIEQSVETYFGKLTLPDQPTVYDYLLLSLREKDFIATFNWDPLLSQAYKRNRHLGRLPPVVFLHGNVSIGICRHCRVKGFREDVCGQCRSSFEKTPLLYPIAQKNYTSDEFIASEWKELRLFLEHAYFLTFFGYAAPDSDVEAVRTMHDGWSDNKTKTLAEVEIIDIRSKKELERTWEPFFTRQHYIMPREFRRSYLSWHPRRSCEALAFATLQNDPWPDNWYPNFDTLQDLHEWIKPIIDEENRLETDGVPLTRHGDPC